jgi:hypothetical protein
VGGPVRISNLCVGEGFVTLHTQRKGFVVLCTPSWRGIDVVWDNGQEKTIHPDCFVRQVAESHESHREIRL